MMFERYFTKSTNHTVIHDNGHKDDVIMAKTTILKLGSSQFSDLFVAHDCVSRVFFSTYPLKVDIRHRARLTGYRTTFDLKKDY
ncbi:hypothetical protein NECAME_06156 [Necator americanus]|uniref:Uncharacterized protein n=1 Tax=Necator americanus TaxID=51031 RepID=W2TXZ1_NECAM|nr:hypothetical protein NECAME_06156 [Necator americanus]ETN85911.1 hypothetical protein NECAME_06156 [Necator americanus]